MKKLKVLSILVAMLFCLGLVPPAFAYNSTKSGKLPEYTKTNTKTVADSVDKEDLQLKADITTLKNKIEKKKGKIKKEIRTKEKKLKTKQIKNLKKQIKNLKKQGVKGKKLKNIEKKLTKAKKDLKKLKKGLKNISIKSIDKKIKSIDKKIKTKNKQIKKLKKKGVKGKKLKSLKKDLAAQKGLLKSYKKLKKLTNLQNKIEKIKNRETLNEVSKEFIKFENSEKVKSIEKKINELSQLGDVKLTDKDKKYIADFKKRLNSDKNDEKKLKELENDVNVFEEYGGAVVEEMHNLAKNNEKNKYGKYLSNLEIGKILLNSYLDREDMNDILSDCDSLVGLLEMNDGATSSVSDKARSLAANLLYQAEKNGYVSGN